MEKSTKKIQIMQSLILFTVLVYPPTVRLISQSVSKSAHQAGWLCPLFGGIFLILQIYIINSFYSKYKNITLQDIFIDVFGKIIGKIILLIYIFWSISLTCLYTYYYADKILISIFPSVTIRVLILPMIIIIIFAFKMGLQACARAGEIIFLILVSFTTIMIILLFTNFKIKYLIPISYLDILPILKGSLGVSAIWGYLILFFFISDKIQDKECFLKWAKITVIFLITISTLLLSVILGVLSYSLTMRTPLPFITAVRTLPLLESIGRIEPLIISNWISCDFISIFIFSYVSIRMLKSFFKLKNTSFIFTPFFIFISIISIYFSRNKYQVENLSENFYIPFNLTMEFVIPIILWIVAKIRKKV